MYSNDFTFTELIIFGRQLMVFISSCTLLLWALCVQSYCSQSCFVSAPVIFILLLLVGLIRLQSAFSTRGMQGALTVSYDNKRAALLHTSRVYVCMSALFVTKCHSQRSQKSADEGRLSRISRLWTSSTFQLEWACYLLHESLASDK